MHTYVESILRIPELTEFASKQLVADIGKLLFSTKLSSVLLMDSRLCSSPKLLTLAEAVRFRLQYSVC